MNEGLSYHEAVKKVLGSEKGQKVLNKEKQIQPKVEIKDVIFEARVAGISPKIYAERLNKEVDRQNEEILNDDYDEKAAILREAASAGANISDPDVKKKILENFKKQKSRLEIEPTKKEKMIEKIIQTKEDESQKYDYLVGEKIQAGFKGKK